MSVVSKNPFDLLGDDGDESPAPVTKAAPKKAEAPAPAREVPGSGAPKPAGGNATRGGRYPGRGGPRNVYKGDEPRNTGPTSGDGVAEGAENAGGFDGERVPPSRKGNHNHIRDAHTKGPRGSRPVKNYTSGGHSSNRGAGGAGGAGRTPNFGGERRTFERRSGTLPDSQKKIDQGWGADDGEAELNAEVQGERDAVVEENTPQTPAPEAEAPVEADQAGAAIEETAEPAEPEEVQKSYDDYLAERASAALAGIGKKEGRQVTADSLEGSQFVREGVQEFYSAGKEKSATKAKAPKKEKVFIEFDGQFASPPGGGRGRGSDRGGERGGRGGGGRGRGEGRGGPRGGRSTRGGRGRGGPGGASINPTDEKSFPALGA